MSAFDQQIEQGRNRITALIAKKREAIDGGKVQGSSLTYKDFFKTKVDELKALRDQKGKKHDEQRFITEKLDRLEHERQTLLKNLPERRDDQDPAKIR